MPQQEMTASLVAPDENYDKFLGLYYRVDVEALNEWATVTFSMRGSIGFVVQEPEVTDDVKQFLITMCGSNCEKRVLRYQTVIIEQLYALITWYSKLTKWLKRAWLPSLILRLSVNVELKLKGPLSPEVSLKLNKPSGITVRGAGLTCVTFIS